MNAFASSLQLITRCAQETKNAKNIILNIADSTCFLDEMRNNASGGYSSANLLTFNNSSVIAFIGETWKIIFNGIFEDEDCYQVHNLCAFVQTPSFQIALAEVFPSPFQVNVLSDKVEISW